MLALALTLCDKDIPVWLDEAADTPEARHYLRFHCATPFTVHAAEASFAFISQPKKMPRLQDFHPGQAKYPDRSATLVISADLSSPQAHTLELTGPGVKGNDRDVWHSVCISGLPAWFWKDWEVNYAMYPLGVDVLLVDAGSSGDSPVRLMGLPRTTRVRPALNRPAGFLPSQEHAICM